MRSREKMGSGGVESFVLNLSGKFGLLFFENGWLIGTMSLTKAWQIVCLV